MGKGRGMITWSVNALVCFVTKKLVKLTKYANAELNISNHKILESSLASEIVIPMTSSSIMIEAGRRNATATGAMYIRRFIELSFSLRNQRNHFSTDLDKKSERYYIWNMNVSLIQSAEFQYNGLKVWAHYPQQDPLKHCFECPGCCSCDAHYESK